MNARPLQLTPIRLAGALGLAALSTPVAAPAQQPAGTSNTVSTSTSTATVETSVHANPDHGGGAENKVTITIEKAKDGSVQKQVIVLDSDTPLAEVSEIVEQLERDGGIIGGTASNTATAGATRKITYLGVMLAEPASTTGGYGGGYGSGFSGRFATPVNPGRNAVAGIAITGVAESSPAEEAGLKGGDILKKLDDQILVNADQFTALVRDRNGGDEIRLTIERDGSESTVTATLSTREENLLHSGGGSAYGHNYSQPQPGQPFSGRVFRLQPDGSVSSESIDPFGGAGVPVPPGPPVPPTPPGQPTPPDAFVTPVPTPSPDRNQNQNQNQNWNQVWKDAESVRGKAMDEWRNQLQTWREEWSETQKKMSEETRRVMKSLGEEIRRATEAAAKAQEDALRALEAWEAERKRASDGDDVNDAPTPDFDDAPDVEAPDAA